MVQAGIGQRKTSIEASDGDEIVFDFHGFRALSKGHREAGKTFAEERVNDAVFISEPLVHAHGGHSSLGGDAANGKIMSTVRLKNAHRRVEKRSLHIERRGSFTSWLMEVLVGEMNELRWRHWSHL